MKYVSTQASFKSGRLSEKLTGRADVPEYKSGLSIGKNGFVSKSGGAYKRFGIKNLMDIPLGLDDGKVVSYTLFEIQTVNIVLYRSGFQVFDSNGNAISDDKFWAGNFFDPHLFDVALYENKVFITHYTGEFMPYVIEFKKNLVTGKAEIFFSGVIPTQGPYSVPMKDWNTSDVTMRVVNVVQIDVAPSVQVESSSTHFTAGMEGEFLMIKGLVDYFRNGQGSRLELATGMYRIENIVSDTLVDVIPVASYTYTGTGPHDALTNYTATVDGPWIPTNGSGGTGGIYYSKAYTDWTSSAWNPIDGWPKTVSVDEGRLVYGGTIIKPNTFYGSLIGDPLFFMDKRFTQRVNSGYYGDIVETDPYQFTIASDNDSSITFMQPASSFIMGTMRREYIVSGGGSTVSKKNVSVRPHTAHGSKPILTAVYDTNVFYVGTSGKQLFLLRYAEENGSFVSKEISVLFDDLLDEDGVVITDISWNEKLGILFIILSTGAMLTVTVNSETGTLATMEHELEGVEIISTYYTAYPHATRQIFLYKRDGRMFLGEMTDESNTNIPPIALENNLHIKSKHGDLVSEFYQGNNNSFINYIDQDDDFIFTKESDFLLGDEVIFNQPTFPGTTIGTSNINKGQSYYAIPYTSGVNFQVGIRLALSYADALTNTYMDITQLIAKLVHNDEPDIIMSHVKILRYLPIKHIPEGSLVQVTYEDAGVIKTLEHKKLFGEEVIDLGITSTYAFYGIGFEFHIATMPIEAGQQWGSSQIGIKRPDRVSVRYYKSYSFLIGTDGYNEEEEVFDGPETGRADIAITANSEYDSIIHIRNTKIEPCYIMNMTIRGLSNDG